ncbi:hypothetical protein V8G54_020731 [Vigna mungo]|uniref:SWIM-type domain-containing protein n=1 Tax=Vigna mungo TaxID=3915 RepID=A0AAQ3NCQ4_VIGMU
MNGELELTTMVEMEEERRPKDEEGVLPQLQAASKSSQSEKMRLGSKRSKTLRQSGAQARDCQTQELVHWHSDLLALKRPQKGAPEPDFSKILTVLSSLHPTTQCRFSVGVRRQKLDGAVFFPPSHPVAAVPSEEEKTFYKGTPADLRRHCGDRVLPSNANTKATLGGWVEGRQHRLGTSTVVAGFVVEGSFSKHHSVLALFIKVSFPISFVIVGGCVHFGIKVLKCKCLNVGLEMVFEIRLHHMSRFVNDKGLRYVGGEEHVIIGVDPDRWSYFEALGIIKEEFKYAADFKLWWKGSGEIMMNNVRLLSDDNDAMDLAKYAEETEDMVKIYVQHVPSEAEEILFLTCGEESGMSVQQGHAGEEHIEVEIGDAEVGNVEEEAEIVEEEGDRGEEEAEIGEEEADRGEEEVEEETWRNVVEGEVEASAEEFVDQSEEERMDNDDDGFGVESDRVDDVFRDINPVLERRGKVGEGSFVVDDEVGDHEINEEYNSDELDSDLESDEDGNFKRGKFKKFRQDDMNKDFRFSLGMEFGSLKEFKNALMEHSVLNGKKIKFMKNDLTRVRAECKKKCGFLIMASKVGGKETFRVKTLVGRHSCGRVFGNKSATMNWIAQVLIDRFLNVASMSVNQIIDDIKKSFSVGVSAWKAGKAKQIALDSLVGDGERQYAWLYDYVGELLRVKCGTFKIKVNQPQPSLPPRFGAFYMCLEGCKQGFLGSCRPFIGVDGCHLKTTYGDQLLVANECKETWRWFLAQLLDDIGGTECQRWIFISDQQKGLMTVFDELMDGVEHRLCLRHLYNNFKKDLMMGAAKATYEKEWEKKTGELKAINIDAYNWLIGIPTKTWCKHAFSTYCRCDVLINNLTESFNSTILLARDKPIITMMEWIRTYIMKRFATLREKAMTYVGVVMPRPRKRLDKEIEKSGNWIPTWAGVEKFEVTHGFTMDKFVVDLSNKSCSCYSWDLIGIPCRHVIAAINYKVQNPEDYVHVYYKKPAYVTCYAPEIVPINGQQMWPTSENTPLLLPPIYKTPPGRPKKLRRREADEPVRHTKLSKKQAIMKCSSCKEYGHNVRSCRRKNIYKNTRGNSSLGGSGSRPRSEAEASPSSSQGAAAEAAPTAHSGASRVQAARRTASGLGTHHLGSQASTT